MTNDGLLCSPCRISFANPNLSIRSKFFLSSLRYRTNSHRIEKFVEGRTTKSARGSWRERGSGGSKTFTVVSKLWFTVPRSSGDERAAERVLRGGRSDAAPPDRSVVRGPELNTRLMETYAETRYSRGRRRSRSSPRSSSLFHSGSARLYLSAFPRNRYPPRHFVSPVASRNARSANFFESLSARAYATRVARTVEEESASLDSSFRRFEYSVRLRCCFTTS